MDPAFVQDVLRVMERMKARGFPMVLLEGFRSAERQNRLAGGSTKVTQAKGGESKHQYGLAADLAPVRGGKVVISGSRMARLSCTRRALSASRAVAMIGAEGRV
ncbi:M15 family metallopeptidase [Chromobacterium vaccinii]|uniref:M15 family metallopeptidase n=1 Tax=Chromobacterium vaccinii TaxID=1108595 RepID=UPI0034593D63